MGKKQKQPYIYLAHQRLREMVDVDILVESKLNILLLNSPLFITNTESESHNAIVQRNILNNPPTPPASLQGLKKRSPLDKSGFSTNAKAQEYYQHRMHTLVSITFICRRIYFFI